MTDHAISRRTALTSLAVGSMGLAACASARPAGAAASLAPLLTAGELGYDTESNTYALPDLPYAHDALEPHMSKTTLEFHHDKHHPKYVDTLNGLIKGTDHESKGLEDIVTSSDGKLFNQAAQVWNHTFFWNSMKPEGGGVPSGNLAEAIARDFGSFDAFKSEFSDAASGHFGSGWAWLVSDKDGRLSIMQTHDADYRDIYLQFILPALCSLFTLFSFALLF